jgi:hypothetical protein
VAWLARVADRARPNHHYRDPGTGDKGEVNPSWRTPQSAARAAYSGFVSASTPGNGEGQPDAKREARRAARNERREAPAERPGVMIPSGRKRLPLEAPLMRVVATGGIVGIGVVIAAIMTSQDSEGWLIGLVVSIVSVVLAAVLWSSRRL